MLIIVVCGGGDAVYYCAGREKVVGVCFNKPVCPFGCPANKLYTFFEIEGEECCSTGAAFAKNIEGVTFFGCSWSFKFWLFLECWPISDRPFEVAGGLKIRPVFTGDG